MMKRLGFFFTAFFGLTIMAWMGLSTEAAAQSTPKVQQVRQHQIKRIGHGVKNGELTRYEAKRLAQEQRHIQRDVRRAKADGVVTGQERRHIRREQRQANRHIAVQKHDTQDRN
jgi:hypothetical protein